MSLPDPAVVDAALRRLDTDSLVALAADLWAARGFDVARDGSRLVVDGDTVVWVVGDRRVGSPTVPAGSVDVVLAPGAGRTARRVADEADARLVAAAGLREMLWYAVERPVWRTLCAEHLGAAPEALTPPLSTRLRAAGRDAADTAEASLARVTAVPSPAVAVVAVILLVASVGLVAPGLTGTGDSGGEFGALGSLGGFGGGDASTGSEEASGARAEPTEATGTPASDAAGSDSGDGEASVAGDDGEASIAGVESIPGVTRNGIENLSAFTAAHSRSVANRSYTLWFDSYRQDVGRPETRVQGDVDIQVEGERYLLVSEIERNGTRTRVGRVYYDGEGWYVSEPDDGDGTDGSGATNESGPANATGNGTADWRPAESSETASIGPSPFDYREFGLERYLATPNTVVAARLEGDDGRTRYRIIGDGTPSGPFATQMTEYSVVAIVDSEGFVSDLTVEYRIEAKQPYRVRFEWTYGRLGETTVELGNETLGSQNETVEAVKAVQTGAATPAIETEPTATAVVSRGAAADVTWPV
ncbi:hypothetical protein SAMN04487949_3097 [Halogranum gelatinilyticum]|uniref:Uncharacterized protein n=1 Tax=Halogranum gelatinilyticum TaxID=660521 RepID=A0A1G9XRD4_9EURY|nr:hypothetical protein [Halogranum gelatinilyticum]SDM99280.1 hypothetical protein SAMN04487949_3097 [Halogranum gelatinilyticum]